MNTNLLLNTDSYKTSHYSMYPPGCEALSCYIESRGGDYDTILFFGLQAFLIEYLSNPITAADITEAESILSAHGVPFNKAGWEYILEKHQGYLPVEIEAVPEGTLIAPQQVLLQIHNTDPACYWLPTYLETALLRAIWYPTTVATVSWHCKQLLTQYLEETADNTDALPYQLHDFGARGVSSNESAGLGGLAHLVNFRGTDTLAAIVAGQRYYDEPMAGHSIPAAEHSTIISWGKTQEAAAYKHILNLYSGPDKIAAIVCDSYDIWHALNTIFGKTFHNIIKNNAGKIIFRPDSGQPEEMVVQVTEALMQAFGHRVNSKGYKVLPDNIRVIQGDGVNNDSIRSCLQAMKEQQLSAENIAFGMGGRLLQRINRDTAKFAMKANAAKVNGNWSEVQKKPITDLNKTSKGGRLALIKDQQGVFQTIKLDELGTQTNQLRPIFKNGRLLIKENLNQIRDRT